MKQKTYCIILVFSTISTDDSWQM